jgi:hypothetical protein
MLDCFLSGGVDGVLGDAGHESVPLVHRKPVLDEEQPQLPRSLGRATQTLENSRAIHGRTQAAIPLPPEQQSRQTRRAVLEAGER